MGHLLPVLTTLRFFKGAHQMSPRVSGARRHFILIFLVVLVNLLEIRVTTTSDANNPETKGLFKRIKSQLESCNGRFKNFNFISNPFRQKGGTDKKLKKHKAAFEAVAVLVQYDIESGKSLFEA
jgi:hypothetical protein